MHSHAHADAQLQIYRGAVIAAAFTLLSGGHQQEATVMREPRLTCNTQCGLSLCVCVGMRQVSVFRVARHVCLQARKVPIMTITEIKAFYLPQC